MSEDVVIQVLISAVNDQPDNIDLRLHLATTLRDLKRYSDALIHAQAILTLNPVHPEALKLAAEAARETGDLTKAVGFERIINAMGMSSAMRMIEESIPEPEPIKQKATLSESYSEESFDEESDGPEFTELETPAVTLHDVKGLQTVKDRLNLAFLGPLRNPELRKLYGKSLKGGLLLYGPPGCGKTFIARAVAGELGAKFLSIGLTDVVDMYLGNSEKNLHEYFQSARRNQPCVVFIDEIDALGRKRSLMRHSAGSTIINQLLNELDGAQFNNEGVFVIGATNHPWDVDVALRRPGRFDRTVLVLPPDDAARQQIIEAQIADRPTKGIDSKWIAIETEGLSGADLSHLVESAVELALSDSIKSGKVREIDMGDFKKTIKQVKPSTVGWFETAKNHALFANEGGYYDDLLEYMKRKRMI